MENTVIHCLLQFEATRMLSHQQSESLTIVWLIKKKSYRYDNIHILTAMEHKSVKCTLHDFHSCFLYLITLQML